MGRTLAGAVICGAICVLVPAVFATWDLEVELSQPRASDGRDRSFIKVGRPVKRLVLSVCGAAGAIVGAIAGAASSRPDCRPATKEFWITLAILAALPLIAYALWWALVILILRSPSWSF